MALVIPNEASALHIHQSFVDSTDLQIISQGLNQEGVISGCLVSQRGAGANMSVDVAVGQVTVSGFYPYLAATNLTIDAADGLKPRFDLIVADYNAGVTVVAGVPNYQPFFPSIPVNTVVLAVVYVPVGTLSILNANIVDKRCLVPLKYTTSCDFIAGSTEDGELGNGYGVVGTVAQQGGTISHPGVMRLTGAAGAGICVPTASGVGQLGILSNFRLLTAVIAPAAAITSDTTGISLSTYGYFGGGGSSTSSTLNGVGFVANTTGWRAYIAAESGGGVYATVGTANAPVNGTWIELDIAILFNGNYQFAFNGMLIGTASTGLPLSSGACNLLIASHAGATPFTLDIDFIGLIIISPEKRFT